MGIKLLILTFACLLFGVSPVFAVTVTISNIPSSITEQPFNIDISITGASSATNYLRADFFQPNTTNYFGYTFNGTDWYNGSLFSQYIPIIITSSGYSGTIQAKIDTNSSKFQGNGTYNLRVRRYTQSGGYTSGESNIISLNVNIDSPTPSPTQTPTPTPSPAPTSTPTSTPSPTPKPKATAATSKTPTPTANPTIQPTVQPSVQDTTTTPVPVKSKPKLNYQIASVAAITTSATPAAQVSVKSQKQTNYFIWVGIILIFAGTLSIGYIYLRKNADIHIKLRKRD